LPLTLGGKKAKTCDFPAGCAYETTLRCHGECSVTAVNNSILMV
jgi:hypothetical protein